MPDLLQLVCFEGPCEGVMFSKPSTVLTVGRTNRSKICVKDPSVSEKHAKIEWSGKGWFLQDLGSSNGTKVNGQSLQEDGQLFAFFCSTSCIRKATAALERPQLCPEAPSRDYATD